MEYSQSGTNRKKTARFAGKWVEIKKRHRPKYFRIHMKIKLLHCTGMAAAERFQYLKEVPFFLDSSQSINCIWRARRELNPRPTD